MQDSASSAGRSLGEGSEAGRKGSCFACGARGRGTPEGRGKVGRRALASIVFQHAACSFMLGALGASWLCHVKKAQSSTCRSATVKQLPCARPLRLQQARERWGVKGKLEFKEKAPVVEVRDSMLDLVCASGLCSWPIVGGWLFHIWEALASQVLAR